VLQLIRAKQFNAHVQSTQGYKNWATCLLFWWQNVCMHVNIGHDFLY